MLRKAGTYALVMPLVRQRRMKIGQFGTFSFPPGWYVYIGSAFGAGGVAARVGRHLKSPRADKPDRWNVDHFRHHVPISEVWFTHDTQRRECQWAQTLVGMDGAEAPVPGFGSNDCTRCPAHLVRFPFRPSQTLFRRALAGVDDHAAVYVHFAAEEPGGPLEAGPEASALAARYQRGRRYLESRRSEALHQGLVLPERLTRFSGDRRGQKAAARLADEFGVSEQTLRADAKLAEAVETLLKNCGAAAQDVVLLSGGEVRERDVLALAKTSPQRQRHRIEGVAQGRFRSIKPQSSDNVFDTVAFAEVTSRLRRARGSVERSGELLRDAVATLNGQAHRVVTTTVAIHELAVELTGLLEGLPSQANGHAAATRRARQTARRSRLRLEHVPRQLASARSLLAKNVRDLPRLPPELWPTQAEATEACHETQRVLAANEEILRLPNEHG